MKFPRLYINVLRVHVCIKVQRDPKCFKIIGHPIVTLNILEKQIGLFLLSLRSNVIGAIVFVFLTFFIV
jgi:hypothetical protein